MLNITRLLYKQSFILLSVEAIAYLYELTYKQKLVHTGENIISLFGKSLPWGNLFGLVKFFIRKNSSFQIDVFLKEDKV